ncbi:MAG: DUF1738 domain-containing protein [Hyphomicrobiaceae bacterium]|nr:DUF1738 domain-containing protein [Hyphomicrobiaceae bacterium]
MIKTIEWDACEFKLPWHRPAGSLTRPVNIHSRKTYRVINVMSLWIEAQIKSYSTPVLGNLHAVSGEGLPDAQRRGDLADRRLQGAGVRARRAAGGRG